MLLGDRASGPSDGLKKAWAKNDASKAVWTKILLCQPYVVKVAENCDNSVVFKIDML